MSEATFSETAVAVDGTRLHCRAAGSGPVLVCLHGGGGLRLTRAHALLAESHRVLALELPGFGNAPPAPDDLGAFAALLNRAVAALGIERCGLMGHGLGAGLALAMAMAHPESIQAIVLLAPLAIRPRPPADRIGRELLYAHPERQPEPDPLPAAESARQRETAARLLAAFAAPQFEAALKELDIPVLSLFGTEDRVAPTEGARVYRTMLPRGHIAMVYDAAHAIDAERPEAVAAIASDFLARGERFIVSNEPGLINP